MTTVTDPALAGPLAPITATLSAMRARRGPVATQGLAPGLVLPDPPGLVPADSAGWIPATALASGDQMDALLDAAKRRWDAAPHAAAALAWKAYSYWLALPAVLGWASARRVPLLDPSRVLVRFTDHQPLLSIGLRRATVAVLPSDPLLATSATPAWDLRVVADEAELLATLRHTLLDAHLTPVMDRIRERAHLGQRTLLGSVASGVAYGVTRASDALPGSTVETVGTLTDALGVADLVSLRQERTGELTVQRHTCCLAFTLPEPKICSGCCIRP